MGLARENAVPPYIVFNDKTLIDMCIKLPQTKTEMLNVSGVGEAKYEKYGEQFINSISEFLQSHPGVVTSIVDDSVSEEESETRPKEKKKKARKGEFFINESDMNEFVYKEYYYLTDIKNELNRISTAENVKKLTGVRIMEYLMSKGYVEEHIIDEKSIKNPTESGREKGIITVEKISQAGFPYTLLMYPIEVQKEIVAFFANDSQTE